ALAHWLQRPAAFAAGQAVDFARPAGKRRGFCRLERLRSGAPGGRGRLREEQPGFHHGVRVEREALDALLDQPAGEVRVVRGALAADTDVLALSAAGADRHRDELAHRLVALVEVARHDG